MSLSIVFLVARVNEKQESSRKLSISCTAAKRYFRSSVENKGAEKEAKKQKKKSGGGR